MMVVQRQEIGPASEALASVPEQQGEEGRGQSTEHRAQQRAASRKTADKARPGGV